MRKISLTLFIGCILCSLSSNAQSFEDLKTKKGENHFEKGWVKLFFRYTNVNGKYTESISGPTINATIRSDTYKKGGLRYSFENALLGDAIFNLSTEIKRFKNGSDSDKEPYQLLTSGWIGWHKLAMNAFSSDRLLISPGVSFGDHMIESITYPPTGEKILDPAGYFFYAGPYVVASYVVSQKMWVDAYMNYDITFTKASNPPNHYEKNPGYPLPTVFFIGADVYTTSKLFAGIRVAKLNDSGSFDNSGSRVDFSIGFNF